MIEVRVPKEIREYKPKFMAGLNIRQVISLAAALVICVPLYYFGINFIDEETLSWIVFLIASPIMLFGFFNYNQMNFETFIRVWFRGVYHIQKRPYQETPMFSNIRDVYLAEQRRDILDRLKIQKKKS